VIDRIAQQEYNGSKMEASSGPNRSRTVLFWFDHLKAVHRELHNLCQLLYEPGATVSTFTHTTVASHAICT
jgi:hypothetical protein